MVINFIYTFIHLFHKQLLSIDTAELKQRGIDSDKSFKFCVCFSNCKMQIIAPTSYEYNTKYSINVTYYYCFCYCYNKQNYKYKRIFCLQNWDYKENVIVPTHIKFTGLIPDMKQ